MGDKEFDDKYGDKYMNGAVFTDDYNRIHWVLSEGTNGFEWGEIDPLQEDWIEIDKNVEVLETINDFINKKITTEKIKDLLSIVSADVEKTGIFNNVKQKQKIDATINGMSIATSSEIPASEMAKLARTFGDYNDFLMEAKNDKMQSRLRQAAKEYNEGCENDDDKIDYDAWIPWIDTSGVFDMSKDELYNELKKKNALPFSADIAYTRPANTYYENSRYSRGDF